MSRILEFQPTDEQTVIARVLVELHQAIDVHFPGAAPSARQFTKTVLTHQGGESTRVDNSPANSAGSERQDRPAKADELIQGAAPSDFSMTPKTGLSAKKVDTPLATEELRRMMGETTMSRRMRKVLIGSLVAGVIVFAWIYFGGIQSLSGHSN